MTVGELIERLGEYDPEANVLIMSQEGWPFENSIRNIIGREEIEDVCSCPNHEHEEDCEAPSDADDRPQSDVFIVEGEQLRYGNKKAWER